MSRSKWITAAALFALGVPAASAGDRTRVQITIAPYWGWGAPVYRPGPRVYRHGYPERYGDSRYGSHYGSAYGRSYGDPYGEYYRDPVIRFGLGDVYRFRDRDFRRGGDRRYDSRRHRDYYRGHDRRD